jgi:LytS/YehU family sensor histidine kinase
MALQGQTNPHFLFNSLNTIRALMPATATEARRAITLLADTLRATLIEGKKASIPLARELEIVRAYLSLERLRFEEDLNVEEDIAPAALDAHVPSLMLQTLVENAIKHGLLRTGGRGVLRLSAESNEDAVWLRVCSPGTLDVATEADASLGIGLDNVRERLRLLFGPDASLNLGAPRLGIIEAVVRIPHTLVAQTR